MLVGLLVTAIFFYTETHKTCVFMESVIIHSPTDPPTDIHTNTLSVCWRAPDTGDRSMGCNYPGMGHAIKHSSDPKVIRAL